MDLPNRRLLSLLTGSRPAPDRIFHHGIWFRGHNNPRHAAFLPRLTRLDSYRIVCSDQRVVRGVQFRALRATRGVRYRAVLAAAARRYRWAFMTDPEQVPYFGRHGGQSVIDLDDPVYSEEEIGILNHPSVRAFVVTTDRAGRKLESLGARTPWHVISQGVILSSLDEKDVAGVAGRHRRPSEVVFGYVAAWLFGEDDRGGSNPLYNIEHLLELWQGIHAELPSARLWLVGEPSSSIRKRLSGRDDVLLLGRLPQEQVLAYVSNFDVALYPRRVDHAPFAVKVAEYMGVGVPTLSYDLDVTRMLIETGAGVQVSTPRDFVAAAVQLGSDESERRRLAAGAAAAGASLDIDRLAERYETEVFDRYFR